MSETLRPGTGFAVMGEGALLVLFPNVISSATNDRVHGLARTLKQAAVPGIVDLVPAFATLLITFDPDITSHGALIDATTQILEQRPKTDSPPPEKGREHLVPVHYGGDDGPDLDETAALHSLQSAAFVEAHAKRAYKVYFLGFLPGFAYLGKIPSSIASPRLASPRVRVPSGSVGIAGGQTAVYPFASPGGWRIIGRTALSVWDPLADPPTRFNPGDVVHFVPSGPQPDTPAVSTQCKEPERPLFHVLDAQGFTTVQDLGRPGLAHLGVARGGVFDGVAATVANTLVGNAPSAALLEMTWTGPTLRVLRSCIIALAGANLECRADGTPIPPGLSWFVRTGVTLSFAPQRAGQPGIRAYLAVAGGIDAPVVLGSRSTALQARFGGLAGRALQPGDIIGAGDDNRDGKLVAGRYWPGSAGIVMARRVTLRFIAYRGRGQASSEACESFQAKDFVLTEQADRMGYRFRAQDGAALPTEEQGLLSFGIVRGAIQLPPDGHPLVLNVDHQTTGGYPLLGVVIQADWALLAQMVPGTVAEFRQASLDEAALARLAARDDMATSLRRLVKDS